MASTFIAGYLAEMSLGAVALEQAAATGSLKLDKNIMRKPTAGDQAPVAIAGQRTGELSLDGHCSTEDVTLLNTAYDSDTELAFVFQIGESGGDDAGSYAGNCLVESFEMTWVAEDDWSFTMSAITSGDTAFTPPV
jgi:hypothetical protein